MPTVPGPGPYIPELQEPVVTFWTDELAAARLRDRLAREIADLLLHGSHGLIGDLLPTYRYLNNLAEGDVENSSPHSKEPADNADS